MFNFVFQFILYRFIALYDKFNFMVQILINIFRPIKIKIKNFGISYHNYIFFHYYNDLIKLFLLFFLLTFLVNLLCWCKRYIIFLISFFNLFELFPVFICDSNIGCLVNNFFEVKIFNYFPSFTSFWYSSGSMSDKSTDSY